MDKDKSTTRDLDGDQTSMRAWSITRWTSLSTQKWSSNLGLDHGGLVNLIIHDNFLMHIDTLLREKNSKRGEKMKDLVIREVSSISFTKRIV
jgi:hypothetical protein